MGWARRLKTQERVAIESKGIVLAEFFLAWGTFRFDSIKAFNLLDEAHSHDGGWSDFFSKSIDLNVNFI